MARSRREAYSIRGDSVTLGTHEFEVFHTERLPPGRYDPRQCEIHFGSIIRGLEIIPGITVTDFIDFNQRGFVSGSVDYRLNLSDGTFMYADVKRSGSNRNIIHSFDKQCERLFTPLSQRETELLNWRMGCFIIYDTYDRRIKFLRPRRQRHATRFNVVQNTLRYNIPIDTFVGF